MRTGILWSVGALFVATAVTGCPTINPKLECETNDDCFDGYACDALDTKLCLRECSDNRDCLASQECAIPAGQTEGVCRAGAPASDGQSGDTVGGDTNMAPGDTNMAGDTN